MRDITPADLARFVHPVPVGVTIPAGTEHVIRFGNGSFCLMVLAYDWVHWEGDPQRWTAEPIAAPEPTLAERARAVAETARINSLSNLALIALIVAELADRIESGHE